MATGWSLCNLLCSGALSEDTANAGDILSSCLVPLWGASPLLLPHYTAHSAAHPPEKVTGTLLSCRRVTRQALGGRGCYVLSLSPGGEVPSPYSKHISLLK